MTLVATHSLQPGHVPDAQQVYNAPCELKITRGYVALLDAEDFARLGHQKYFAVVNPTLSYYVRAARRSKGWQIYLHHDVLGMHPKDLKGQQVDHIDRNPLNNCRNNLRIGSRKDNMQNSIGALTRKGYCYNKRAKLWFVYLDTAEGRKNLGYTKTEEQAAAWVQRARTEYNAR